MFAKLNPRNIINAHYNSLRSFETGKSSLPELLLHLIGPAVVAALHAAFVDEISENVVSIIVSAASIVAGLMLNLLVLIYTLAFNVKANPKPFINIDIFKQVSSESLSTIAFSILLCLALVISCFLALSRFPAISFIGRFLTVYLGTSVIMCLLIVLKRCYIIVQQELK